MEMSNCPNFEMSLLDLSQKEHCYLILILCYRYFLHMRLTLVMIAKWFPINFIIVLCFLCILKRNVLSLLDRINQSLSNNDI